MIKLLRSRQQLVSNTRAELRNCIVVQSRDKRLYNTTSNSSTRKQSPPSPQNSKLHPFKMQAVHVDTSSQDPANPYSPANPAPSTALKYSSGIPIPQPSQPGDILVRVKAASIIRDLLTWPETYSEPNVIPGNDFAGVVSAVFDQANSAFKPGDEVYGMADAERPCTWAEYAIIKETEAGHKPSQLSFAEAAAIPLSLLTAYEALFKQAKLPTNDFNPAQKSSDQVLILGSSGAVGTYVVQLAVAAGYHVVAASSSNARNKTNLLNLGAAEAIEYPDLFASSPTHKFKAIIDLVGGSTLEKSWPLVAEGGSLIAIESASYEFPDSHKKAGIAGSERSDVNALFFIVSPDVSALEESAKLLQAGRMTFKKPVEYPLSKPVEAYDACHGKDGSPPNKGKIVFTM